MVIIDTSAWVEFFRRDGDLQVKLSVKGLLNAFEGVLCGPVEMEFFGGALPTELDKIKTWFDIIPYMPNDQKIWRKTAQHFSQLTKAGYTIPWNDVIIATLCLEKRCWAYAHDKHFQAMSDILGLRLYRPGYNGNFNPDYS